MIRDEYRSSAGPSGLPQDSRRMATAGTTTSGVRGEEGIGYLQRVGPSDPKPTISSAALT